MPEQKPTLYDRVVSMADELGLTDDEKDKYVNQSMTRAGWKPSTSWSPPDGKDGGSDKSSGWFKE